MSKANPGSDPRIDQIFQSLFSDVGSSLRETQRRIIDSVLSGHNTLGLMPTGSGKSLAYWIAGKALGGITLVIFPLTALMDEQEQKLKQHGCRVFVLHSGIDAKVQYQELIDLYNERDTPDFIFVSPERLATDGFVEFVLRRIRERLKLVVVDEAHCISQWGLDFRPFYKEIPHFLNTIFQYEPLPTILCLTATLNPKDREQICADFGIDASHVIRHDVLLRPEISIRVIKVPNEDTKDERLWALLADHRDQKVLVYQDRKASKRGVEALCADAQALGYKARYFHGDMSSDEKKEVIHALKAGEISLVFATSAFGMGIDIPDIRGVVHYLLTESAEQYYQQIGRAGRDSKPAWAVLFYSEKNIDVRRTWYIEKSFPTKQEVETAFGTLTDNKIGKRTVNYFDEGDETRSAYHYLVRSTIISPVCKAVSSLDTFEPVKGMDLPEFQAYRNASKAGLLIRIAKNIGKSEREIIADIYRLVAERKLKTSRSPSKCLVIESFVDALPVDLAAQIQEDVATKKGYRMTLFEKFVELLDGYTTSDDFHQKIGEYLGIDRFSRERTHRTLSGDDVRSKSEVIIANILYQSHIPFVYEAPLVAPDGSKRVPDFTIDWNGRSFFWEHFGMLDDDEYYRSAQLRKAWYATNFPGQLIVTEDSPLLSQETKRMIATHFASEVSTPDEVA